MMWMRAPNSGAQQFPDPIASAYLGAAATIPHPLFEWTRKPGEVGAPPAYVTAEAHLRLNGPIAEICPTCHYELPQGWRDGHAICIAISGARATGKSIYIGVLIKQLELLCEQLGVSMAPVTRATQMAYTTNYETPLFVQRGLIQATPTVRTQTSLQREPLMYSVGMWQGVQRFVVLRDVAGEDLETGDLQIPAFRFFANADAVLFMFDPLRVKSIRDQLQDLLPAQNTGGDPRAVLNNVLMAIGQGQPKLAVILSKFDALRALQDVDGSQWSLIMSNAGAAYSRDTSGQKNYDEPGGRLLHEEVRSLLSRLNAGSLVAAVENPSSGMRLAHRFFVVSALGHPPNGQQVPSRGIAPFRCNDPVRWVTSAFGVL
jgi:hypothetical protein